MVLLSTLDFEICTVRYQSETDKECALLVANLRRNLKGRTTSQVKSKLRQLWISHGPNVASGSEEALKRIFTRPHLEPKGNNDSMFTRRQRIHRRQDKSSQAVLFDLFGDKGDVLSKPEAATIKNAIPLISSLPSKNVIASNPPINNRRTVPIIRYGRMQDVPYIRDQDTKEGSGSGTTIYRAAHARNGDVVAIKIVNCTSGHPVGVEGSYATIIQSEISLMERCSHPNLIRFVTAFEVATWKNSIFIVMQPWAPVTLGDLIFNVTNPGISPQYPWWSQLDPFNKCAVPFRGLLEGLEYLHNQLIFHKDIKPENILFEGSKPIITDFGISKLYRAIVSTNYTKSTYQFLAPEQTEHKESSPRSDVFAMGCCFLLLYIVTIGGSTCLKELDDELLSPSYQYARQVSKIYAGLCKKLLPSVSRCDQKLAVLSVLIHDMLLTDPSQRLTATSAKEMLAKIPLSGDWELAGHPVQRRLANAEIALLNDFMRQHGK